VAETRRRSSRSSGAVPQLRDPAARVAGILATCARTLAQLHQQIAGAYAQLALKMDAEAAARVVEGVDDGR